MKKITRPEQLTKKELAHYIEDHHLYTGDYNSKNYYKYSRCREIDKLLKKTKAELLDDFTSVYEFCVDEEEERGFWLKELSGSQICW